MAVCFGYTKSCDGDGGGIKLLDSYPHVVDDALLLSMFGLLGINNDDSLPQRLNNVDKRGAVGLSQGRSKQHIHCHC